MKAVLERMRYPEKEMTLLAIVTGMNVAEICGLQWKHVNLSALGRDGERRTGFLRAPSRSESSGIEAN